MCIDTFYAENIFKAFWATGIDTYEIGIDYC